MKFSSVITALGLMALASSGALAAPILTVSGDQPASVTCNSSNTVLTAESGGTATQGQHDLGNCPDGDTQVTAAYSGLIMATNGTPGCTLVSSPSNSGFEVSKNTSPCTVNVTLMGGSEPEPEPEPEPESEPTEPPKPVPTLPFYALFIMAGLLSVVGLRQLMK